MKPRTTAHWHGAPVAGADTADRRQPDLDSLFEALDDYLWVLDTEGHILDYNRAVAEGLGYGVSLHGRPVWTVHPAEDRGMVEQVIAEIAGGRRTGARCSLLKADGGRIMVDARATRGSWKGQPALFVVSRDITEQLRAEDQIRKLSLAVEQSPENIVITDVHGTIEYVNEAFVRLTGYSREEAIGRNARILKSGKTLEEDYRAMWNALARGRSWKGKFHNRRKDGREYVELALVTPIRQPDGRVTHYVAVKEDITEKERLSEELERHRNHLEEVVAQRTRQLEEANLILSQRSQEVADLYNNAPCGYHSLDSDGNFVAINDTELGWLGYRRDEVVGKLNITQVISPHGLRKFQEKYPEFKRTGFTRDLEFDFVRKDGSLLPGLAVDTAEDGREAVDKARATAYDLILMDVQMPEMDGLDATRAIRALPQRQSVPILAMTANAFNEDRRRCLQAGMDDHVGKPVEPEKLFAALLAWLSKRERSRFVPETPTSPQADHELPKCRDTKPGLDAENASK
jgi:PAS domain S-box-containing protein